MTHVPGAILRQTDTSNMIGIVVRRCWYWSVWCSQLLDLTAHYAKFGWRSSLFKLSHPWKGNCRKQVSARRHSASFGRRKCYQVMVPQQLLNYWEFQSRTYASTSRQMCSSLSVAFLSYFHNPNEETNHGQVKIYTTCAFKILNRLQMGYNSASIVISTLLS